ncbi:MAG: ribonuclease R [Reyranellaceae bacterium]
MPRSKPPRHPRQTPRKPPRAASRGLPSREQVLEFIKDSPTPVGKREIARAFGVDAKDRIALKKLLKEIESEGSVARGRKRRLADPDALPEMIVLQIVGLDPDGEVLARPLDWDEGQELPHIVVAPDRQGVPALARGDRILARLRRVGGKTYEARAVRFLGNQPLKVLGVFEEAGWGGRGRVVPTDKRARREYVVEPEDRGEARPGDIVWIEPVGARGAASRARILERLGSMQEPRTVSLIAIAAHDIAVEFGPEARRQAERVRPAPMGERVDLRSVPLVTIDGEDARDFDDAVFAEADDDPANKGGWKLIVAIADVAWYVRPDDALDRAAARRGNSVYFPDRVVPMLPEELSNGWCSLRPREDRPVLAAQMRIDAEGRLLSHRFVRGMMNSAARLTYTQVQAAHDGRPDDLAGPLLDTVIKPLYGAYRVLLAAREKRGAIDLDLPERKTVIDEKGRIVDIAARERLDSHKLIEEFMICANVAAAQALEHRRMPCMYRVHEPPDPLKIEGLREFLDSLDLRFAGGRQVRPADFNGVLRQIEGRPQARMVNEMILRSQSQAVYSPDNLGHFGLALQRYAHFTSPIRRYADLLVHRALIGGYGMGEGGLPLDAGKDFPELGVAISGLERKAIAAERDATDRYVALFLADRVGASFAGRVNGVTRFGLFVTLDDTGADGLVPISSLGREYFEHDERRHCLTGRSTGATYYLGDRVRVKLAEAEPITGGLIFELETVVESFGQSAVPAGRSARKPGSRHGKGGGKGGGGAAAKRGFKTRRPAKRR